MPIYSYFCAKCNKNREGFRSVDGRDKGPACDKCGHTMKRVDFPKTDIKNTNRTRLRDPFQKI